MLSLCATNPAHQPSVLASTSSHKWNAFCCHYVPAALCVSPHCWFSCPISCLPVICHPRLTSIPCPGFVSLRCPSQGLEQSTYGSPGSPDEPVTGQVGQTAGAAVPSATPPHPARNSTSKSATADYWLAGWLIHSSCPCLKAVPHLSTTCGHT